ncbi:PAAR-like domain-containing protein [Cereibacter azotoformans]|uniref:PAAR-like domain-containing protein n=1 Tax=Cereibacter azotoformans TaxID=43057 RepID=UPI000C6E35F3|nr:PAAR-like domain-containing protein [Cereibacter azotoformans]
MGKPVARTEGTCMAFPDILNTPTPSGALVPIPYPNIAQLADAQGASADVMAGGKPVILEDSRIPTSSGGEAGTGGGATSGTFNQACTFTSCSRSVKANGKGIVRQLDRTAQNNDNAQGVVLAGLTSVLVGD